MNRFSNILFVADAGIAHGEAMERAVSLAENNQADLTVIDVVPLVKAGIRTTPGGPAATELQSDMVSSRRAELESLVAPYQQHKYGKYGSSRLFNNTFGQPF